ncbi:MAG: 3-carboxy-cis,cis-muconate cycloisomerase [Acidobacteria bacterium]|nr:MAG: 3-carboxy-cis,cis-muconate cycloisomerase [Acidobacteriota bacterium]
MSVRLLESLATTDALADVFSDAALLSAMLRFEAALARAEARAGVVPASAADAIAAVPPEAFDAAALARASRKSGTIATAFVDALIARVEADAPAAAAFVHWGATSQDVTDTALVLCLARAKDVLAKDHARLVAALRRLSDQHRDTVMLARTLLQPAAPTTFGLKVAGWFGGTSRSYAGLAAAYRDACVTQFGGAAGTLAALGPHGLAVAQDLARDLGLALPDAPWHTHRERLAALVASFGVYTGSLAKIARDVTLLMQFEVAEAAEPGGGSSSMPHKRNPAGCAVVLAAATRVPGLVSAFLSGMAQEHERAVGGWHAEATTIAAVVQSCGSALAATADLVETLTVDPDRMRRNLSGTRGVVFAERAMVLLSPALGRQGARRAVGAAIEAASAGGESFVRALTRDAEAAAVLGREAQNLDKPDDYLGSAEAFRRRLLGDEKD